MLNSAFIVGATSGLGLAIAHQHSQRSGNLVLVARDVDELAHVAADIRIRHGVEVTEIVADLSKQDDVTKLVKTYLRAHEQMRVYICAGAVTDYPDFLIEPAEVERLFAVNTVGVIQFLNGILPKLATEGWGEVGLVSSVAGLKGKGNNPVYGASKAALNLYAEGMRNAYKKKGLTLTTIYPGFLDTSMTYGMGPLPMLCDPKVAAKRTVCAVDKKKDVVFVPWMWRFIMLIFQFMPGFLYNKMSFIEDTKVE